MPRKSRTGLAIAVVAALGCAFFEQQQPESLLESAGFRVVAANTPEKIQALNSLPAGKISRVDRNGTTYFVYPDPGSCRCLRVGREEQYARYQRLAASKKMGTLQVTGADASSQAFKGYDPW